MQTKVILALLVVASAVHPILGQPPAARDSAPIKSADFPIVARRVDAFEQRINSKRVEDREEVVFTLRVGWRLPDAESVKFLKHVLKQDADPWIRGFAAKTLYEMWAPLEPGDLPASLCGYHRGQFLNRRRKELCDDLIAEVKQGGVEAGYAAYALGLLRCRKATPQLRDLAESNNEFVRYTAGRALIDCGDKEGAIPILRTLMNHPVPRGATIREIVDPHYQALAARAYMELGAAEKKAGIERLIALMDELAVWDEINAQGRLQSVRQMLATVSGEYFLSSKDARAWHEEQRRNGEKPPRK
jgi:hypothetical protein